MIIFCATTKIGMPSHVIDIMFVHSIPCDDHGMQSMGMERLDEKLNPRSPKPPNSEPFFALDSRPRAPEQMTNPKALNPKPKALKPKP